LSSVNLRAIDGAPAYGSSRDERAPVISARRRKSNEFVASRIAYDRNVCRVRRAPVAINEPQVAHAQGGGRLGARVTLLEHPLLFGPGTPARTGILRFFTDRSLEVPCLVHPDRSRVFSRGIRFAP
jgi:hypothetical protein